jgi:drug/metabolite transporter (DMT)-like permease
VAYLIPLVAIFWGFLDGEKLSTIQIFSGVIILVGVYLVNKKR